MEFDPEKVDSFLEIFNNSCEQIGAFPGCKSLKLLRDINQTNVLFTYSVWENAESLEAYRHSGLFEKTWAATKVLFCAKPMAWSTWIEYQT